ncbi:hypothetical protein PFLUV_G00254870 [Perca fluviatilis]|uniref:EDR1/CTR1/ARMC3-like peptidase-like domain-containing protein n=1 Tax=Perca fluviatilis TaxID=8168 RepID=A0A6A5DVB9_PERFL|nr:hypothetical protein PFLUV_G00254870 [Perca fluviatilis]
MGKKVKKESETPCKETLQFEPLPVEGKTPATIVLLLSCPEEDILVKACEAIHTFAEKGDENKVSLLGLGALEPLCQLITHNNKLIRRNAFMALGIMATNGDIKSALKKIMTFHQSLTNCHLKVLSSPDPDVKKNSLEILFNLVQDHQSRLALHELGGIPPLLELLKSDFPVIQHLALKTLQNVTTDTDTCNTFREEQGFEKLMDILSNMDFRDLHAEALQVVANCLSDSKSLQLIHKGGGLTRLMESVLTPNLPEIQSNAVKCIARVAQSSENRKLLHGQNVEKVLVELLSVADISVKTATCQAVSVMSFHLTNGIPAVVQLLNNESLELKEAATQALSILTHSNQLNAFAVYEAGGDEILVQQLYGSCHRTVANSAATLANMAGQEVIRCSILSHGAIQALVEPLQSTDTQVLINTTLCLTLLACDTEARAELQSAAGLHPLVSLLRSYHKEVLHQACLAINVCASDVNAAVEMCQFGALEMLQEINLSVNRRSRFSELAMISLLNFNLSVKYSLTKELSKQPVSEHRQIIVVNTSTEKNKKDDKQKNETQPESPTEKPWKMMDDVSLQLLVNEAKKSILPLSDEREQCAALARLVSEAMGGAVEMEKLHEFPWVLHLSELKFQLQSNVVPIGLISRGIYCHRALLFKCLADCIGMSCTLDRGEYSRAWNKVLLFNGNPSMNERSSQPCRYIVDLMHQPGSLLTANTPAAVQYQTI